MEEIACRALAAGLSGATAIRECRDSVSLRACGPLATPDFNDSEPMRIDIVDHPGQVALFLGQAEQLLRSRLVLTKLVLTLQSSTSAPDLAAAEG